MLIDVYIRPRYRGHYKSRASSSWPQNVTRLTRRVVQVEKKKGRESSDARVTRQKVAG